MIRNMSLTNIRFQTIIGKRVSAYITNPATNTQNTTTKNHMPGKDDERFEDDI